MYADTRHDVRPKAEAAVEHLLVVQTDVKAQTYSVETTECGRKIIRLEFHNSQSVMTVGSTAYIFSPDPATHSSPDHLKSLNGVSVDLWRAVKLALPRGTFRLLPFQSIFPQEKQTQAGIS